MNDSIKPMSDDNWRIVKPLAELLLPGQPMSDEEKAQILDVLIEYADQMALLLVGRKRKKQKAPDLPKAADQGHRGEQYE